MSSNRNLCNAINAKNDEFYTRLVDIEDELKHYQLQFANKIVYCNCDDPISSMFWKYFHNHFADLKLKKLISVHYNRLDVSYKAEYAGNDDANEYSFTKTDLISTGDFRHPECISILKNVDIIVTNPPFSLFGEFLTQLLRYDKKFLIIGNKNSINRNDVFNYLKNNQVWFGYTHPNIFNTPTGTTDKLQGLCRWFTNLDVNKQSEKLILTKHYSPELYPMYDNYRAINVDKVSEIPYDYDGIMGVPITFFDHYNSDQFEILGRSGDTNWTLKECEFFTAPDREKQQKYKTYNKNWRIQNSYLLDENGNPQCIYYRLFIRRK